MARKIFTRFIYTEIQGELSVIKIEPVRPFIKVNNIRKSNDLKNENTDSKITTLYGIPKSYISFKSEKESNVKLSEEGQLFVERAKNIAKEKGNSEITPYHIIEAAIAETEENYAQFDDETLDSGLIASVSTLNVLANNYAKQNVLLSPQLRDYFIQSVENLKAANEEYLEKLPVKSDENSEEPTLSEDFQKLLAEAAAQGAKMDSYVVLGTAFNTLAARGISYQAQFLKDFVSLSYYKTNEDVNEHYMKSYDTRALEVWNKLALGSNLFVTYTDSKEADRITASLIKTIDTPKHGDFNHKNTLLYTMSNEITAESLVDEVEEIKASMPEKRKIIMVNLDSLLANSIKTENNELIYPTELIGLANSVQKDNVKFIFYQNKDAYYQIM